MTIRAVTAGRVPLPTPPPDAQAWVSVGFLALLGTAAAMALLSWAQSQVDATRAAVILTLEPAVAGLTAVAAGTPLTTRTLVGAVLLLAAMSVVELAGRRGSTPATGVPDRRHHGPVGAASELQGGRATVGGNRSRI